MILLPSCRLIRLESNMPVLRLTSKLLAEIDDLPQSGDSAKPSPLGDWYGHIFTIERRKCLIFINEQTLFVCPALGMAKAGYRQIVPFFKGVLAAALRIMRFSEKQAKWILSKHEELQIGRAVDRSVIGSLNNRVADAKFRVAWDGGLDLCDIGALTTELNQTPMKPIGYSNGLERMQMAVEGAMK